MRFIDSTTPRPQRKLRLRPRVGSGNYRQNSSMKFSQHHKPPRGCVSTSVMKIRGQLSVTTFNLGNFSCGNWTPWECTGLFGRESAVSRTPPAGTKRRQECAASSGWEPTTTRENLRRDPVTSGFLPARTRHNGNSRDILPQKRASWDFPGGVLINSRYHVPLHAQDT